MRPPSPSLPRDAAAFSLVEVATAIAVAAFSLASLLALVPLGIEHFRAALDTTVSAQIAQRVITDAEQTDFDLLLAAGGRQPGDFFLLPVRYFDEQAAEVFPATPGAAFRAIYRVLVRAARPGPRTLASDGTGFTSLPADPGKARFRPRDSVFLCVQVAHRPGLDPMPIGSDLLWPANTAPLKTYSTVLTRNGYTPGSAP